MHDDYIRLKDEERGELIVSGKNEAKIKLKRVPHKVDVKFNKKPDPPPCDPHHHHHDHEHEHKRGHEDEHDKKSKKDKDHLEWSLHYGYPSHTNVLLIIEWDVEEIREIVWVAYY